MKRTAKKSDSSTAEQGRISAAVVELLRRQAADRGLVVWYDPQKAYEHLAARLAIADCTLLRYENGFFHLREQLDPLMGRMDLLGKDREALCPCWNGTFMSHMRLDPITGKRSRTGPNGPTRRLHKREDQ